MAIPFDEKELQVVGEEPSFFGPPNPVYNFPVSRAEGLVSLYRDHNPIWVPLGTESNMLCPAINLDNVARAFVFESEPFDNAGKGGGPDIFGVEWVYVPTAGGSMVKPGNPILEDANDWKKVLKFPDVDSWDWEGSAKKNAALLANDKANTTMLLNGCWFERMISWFDFEGAAMALVDEEQIPAVKEMIHATTDLFMKIVDKCAEYYSPLHGVCIHDDWGSQGAPFFSDKAARDIFLPEMKRFVEHVHAKGMWCELHSCGHIEDRADIFVEAGFDCWTPMAMNDTVALYDKYGDRICIGVVNPFTYDAATATEEEQRECARKFVERFCKKGTMVSLSMYGGPNSRAFLEELYKQSRIAYSE